VNGFNYAMYPCTFFDGGYRLYNGPPLDSTIYPQLIAQCGERPSPELELISAADWLGEGVIQIRVRVANAIAANQAPSTPSRPAGDTLALINTPVSLTTLGNDPDADQLYYQWDFGDQSDTSWSGPFPTGEPRTIQHSWTDEGVYHARVRSRDMYYSESAWSAPRAVTVILTCCEVPGDINGSGSGPDISDLVYLVTYMFQGGPSPICARTADINGSGWGPDIADLVYLVSFMFQSGPPPAPCQ
jgi:hypothetical protein